MLDMLVEELSSLTTEMLPLLFKTILTDTALESMSFVELVNQELQVVIQIGHLFIIPIDMIVCSYEVHYVNGMLLNHRINVGRNTD